MFGQVDKTKTEHRQLVDSMHNGEVIEAKIKECQRENDRCMISTSNRLRKQFGDEAVDRTLQRLSQEDIEETSIKKKELIKQ